MDHCIDYVDAFTVAVTARLPHGIRQAVREAYSAGVSREDLLKALEVSEKAAEIPSQLVAFAILAIWSIAPEDRASHTIP